MLDFWHVREEARPTVEQAFDEYCKEGLLTDTVERIEVWDAHVLYVFSNKNGFALLEDGFEFFNKATGQIHRWDLTLDKALPEILAQRKLRANS